MGILVDLIIIAIVAITIFINYKRGLVNVIIGFASLLISIVIVFLLYKPVTNFVVSSFEWDDSIKNNIETTLKGTGVDSGNVTIKAESQTAPEIVVNKINSYIEEATREQKDNISEYVAEKVTYLIMTLGVIIVLFILSNFLLLFLKLFSNALTELPIIKQFNKAGGIVYGIIVSVILVYFILAVILITSSVTNGFGITDAINASYLGKALYNNNLLLKILF